MGWRWTWVPPGRTTCLVLSRLDEYLLRVTKPQGQGVEAAQAHIAAPGDVVGREAEVGEAAQQRLESDLHLQAGEGRAKAEMAAPAEAEMAVVGPVDIETIW